MNRILVTGATGYVGGRLVPRLLEEGHAVRVLLRDPSRLEGHPWRSRVEVVQGDVLRPETLAGALAGVRYAYYLIHSMSSRGDFGARDLEAAGNFGRAAKEAGVERLIYLGGLGDPESDLSHHLRSRQETGAALAEAGVPVTEFRAAIIVGSGSVSFEIIRYLTERLPVMICPSWVYTRVQPISIRDVLAYLIGALEAPASAGQVVEIGGADVLTYGEMMMEYARSRQLWRRLIPVPVLTPKLSSYWVHLVTPISSSIARPLIQGLRNETIVRDDRARELFPWIRPLCYREALDLALERLRTGRVETSWSDALAGSKGDSSVVTLGEQEGIILEHRRRTVAATPPQVFKVFTGLGGDRGWLYANWLWRLRGGLDRLVGGVGFRRGRRHPDELRPGDALDFWRVEDVEPDQLLRLRAEMKVPGLAWLEFRATEASGGACLEQTAFFVPKGLSGLLYWYLVYPFHGLIFSGLARRIADRAEQGGWHSHSDPDQPSPAQATR